MKPYIKNAYIIVNKCKNCSVKHLLIMTIWLLFYRKRFYILYDALKRVYAFRAFSDKSFMSGRKKYKILTCKCCGRKYTNHYLNGSTKNIMEELNYCFECAFWEDKLRTNDSKTFIIDGSRYHDGGKVPKGTKGFIGFGGHEWKIQKFDSDEIIETNNLWHQGDIPFWFRKKMPDNAKFIK